MNSITITSNINAPINKVWEYWTKEEHIKNWNFASPEWHCPNEPKRFIEILLGDARKMSVLFEETESGTLVTETFEPETENSIELQKVGWQMILDNFKRYTENQL
jgi:uncharacterized protein YndB with AHSA1/START domain